MNPESEFYQRDRTIQPPALTPHYKTSVLRSPRIPLWSLQNSLSEVTGPIFRPDELGPLDNDLIRNYAQDGEPSASALSSTVACSTRTGAACPIPFWSSGRQTLAGAAGTRTTPPPPHRPQLEGDPLIPHAQIIAPIPAPAAIQRLIAPLDMNAALPLDSLAYRFDIVLRGDARSCSRTSCREVE